MCQLSPSLNSSLYCFIILVDCHFLLVVVDRSIVGLRTLLKSPPMMILETVKLYKDVKYLWGKKGYVHQYLLWKDLCC